MRSPSESYSSTSSIGVVLIHSLTGIQTEHVYPLELKRRLLETNFGDACLMNG